MDVIQDCLCSKPIQVMEVLSVLGTFTVIVYMRPLKSNFTWSVNVKTSLNRISNIP